MYGTEMNHKFELYYELINFQVSPVLVRSYSSWPTPYVVCTIIPHYRLNNSTEFDIVDIIKLDILCNFWVQGRNSSCVCKFLNVVFVSLIYVRFRVRTQITNNKKIKRWLSLHMESLTYLYFLSSSSYKLAYVLKIIFVKKK